MSGITPAMIAQLAAQAQQNGIANHANYGLPYGSADPLSGNQTWGTGIPYLPNGQINMSALIQQINKIFTWATNGDQADFNTELDMYAMFRNIGAVWGQLGAQGQAEINQTFSATLGAGGPSVLNAIAKDVINAIVGGTYYQNSNNEGDAQKALNDVIADLSNLTGQGASFLTPFLNAAKNMNVQTYLNSLPSNLTMTTFMEEQVFQFEADFSMNSNSTQATNQQMSDWINDLTAGLPVGLELIILIIVVMISMNGDQQVQLTGKANETNALTNAVINPLNSIQGQWNTNQGKWTASSIAAFYNSLAGAQFVVGGNSNGTTILGDARFQPDQSSVNQLYNDFNGTGTDISGTNGVNGATGPVTVGGKTYNVNLGTLYACASHNPPLPIPPALIGGNSLTLTMDGAGQAQTFCTIMDTISMNQANPTIVPAAFTQINSDITTAINAASSQSQSVGTAVQSLQQVIDKFESLITSILQDILNLEKTSTTASASAGN